MTTERTRPSVNPGHLTSVFSGQLNFGLLTPGPARPPPSPGPPLSNRFAIQAEPRGGAFRGRARRRTSEPRRGSAPSTDPSG